MSCYLFSFALGIANIDHSGLCNCQVLAYCTLIQFRSHTQTTKYCYYAAYIGFCYFMLNFICLFCLDYLILSHNMIMWRFIF